MAQHEVRSATQIPVPADQVWSLLRDFCGQWHPAINTMAAEYDQAGHLIRAFTVQSEETVYRERLSWFSDSERSLAYTHVAGIVGVDHYTGRLQVVDDGGNNATVIMTAQLSAAEPRAGEIAKGTKAIFDDGLAAIEAKVGAFPPLPQPLPEATFPQKRSMQGGKGLKTIMITGSPTLAVSHTENSHSDKNSRLDNTLCLFLHGIGGNRHNWDQQLAAVSPYCRAAALDLRGYGDSALGAKQTTIDDYCADILRVAAAFEAQKLILCGLSYGAWIATSFALRYPERLAGLVLSGGCTGMSEAGVAEREAFRHSREVPLSEGKTPADFAPSVVSVLAGPVITEAVREELLAAMQAIPVATYADALRCFTNPPETFAFSKLTMPVLLMTGEADKLAPPAEIRQVAERIFTASPTPDVRYECLAQAGHVCNLEAPAAFNAPLLELLQRVA